MRALVTGALLIAASACEPERTLVAPDAGATEPTAPLECLRVPAEIDFGEVPTGQRVDQQVSMGRVTRDRSAFSFVGVNAPFNVVVRDQGALTNFVFSFVAPDARLQVQRAEFLGGFGCTPQVVELRGLGAGGIELTNSLDFGAVPVGQPVIRTISVRNTRRRPTTVFFATAEPFSMQPTVHLEGVSAVEVPVTVLLPNAGRANNSITVRTDAPGESVRQLPVTASGGVPRARLSASDVHVDRLPLIATNIGATRRRLHLENFGDGPLDLDGFIVEAGPMSALSELSVSTLGATTVSANGSVPIDLRFFINQGTGARSWRIEVHTNDPANGSLPLEVSANVAAVQPCLGPVTLTPAALTLAPPYPASATIRVTNPNNMECLIDELHLAELGSWSISRSSDQLVLPALGSGEVTVQATGPGFGVFRLLTIGTAVGYQEVSLHAQ